MTTTSPYFAAVDLGSNSFHMIIARVQDERVEIVDRVKEMVQLAKGINKSGLLGKEAQVRALECLTRFGERLREIPGHQIRAVGTKALRTSSDPAKFLLSAQKALGVPIQVISGYEEARLVYSGLAHSVVSDRSKRLVVDIGGGSTELVIGQDYDAYKLESLAMGCVTYTESFKNDAGKFNASSFNKAYFAACSELETISKNYLRSGWEIAYGTSGTVRAIAELLLSQDGGAVIRAESLEWLAKEIFNNKSSLANVTGMRRSVLPAGLAILKAVFDQLQISAMHVGDAALKEGLLYDIIGRLSDHDARVLTVNRLIEKYNVDAAQAQRVALMAVGLWKQINSELLPGVSRTKILSWAAQLHEVGMSISHSSHHRHGYYIVRHSDLAGFGRYEQYILANLVLAHRKGLYAEKFADVDSDTMQAMIPLIICLRIAVVLNRHREDSDVNPDLLRKDTEYQLNFAPGWLQAHPLTHAGLELETKQCAALGISLSLS